MATLRDIAEMVGVSVATVSRVLAGKESKIRISEETKRRVWEAARKLNYQANLEARRLRKGEPQIRTVGVIDCGSNGGIGQHPFFSQFLAHIEEAVRIQGGHLLYRSFPRQHRGNASDELLDSLIDRLHGAITFHSIPRALRERLLERGLPVVAFEPYLDVQVAWPTYYLDYEASMKALSSHLAQVGHRRVAFLSYTAENGSWEHPPFVDRFLTFVECAKNEGIAVIPFRVEKRAGETDMDIGRRALLELLGMRNDFTCAVAANDLIAFGAIGGARYAGLRVPDDVAVAGFDDIDTAAYMNPPLTTIRVDRKKLAYEVVNRLFSVADRRNEARRDEKASVVRFPTHLVIRESTSGEIGPKGGVRELDQTKRQAVTRSRAPSQKEKILNGGVQT